MSTTVHEICRHFESVVNPQGWTKKSLTQRDDYSFEVEVEYAEGDPRKWVLVSGDRFDTLDKVKIYELLASPKMGRTLDGPWASTMDCWAAGHASAKAHSEMELSIDRLVPDTTEQGRWDFDSVDGRKEFARAVFQSGWDAAMLRGLLERTQ